MYQKIILLVILLLSSLTISSKKSYAQETEGQIIIVSERVGDVIDIEEKDKYSLFPHIKGFQSAILFKSDDGNYAFRIIYLDETSGEEKVKWISRTEPEIIQIREFIDNFEPKQEEEPQQVKQPPFRIPPKPLRERRTFPITEFGVNYRLTSPKIKSTHIYDDVISTHTRDYDATFYITSDLGLMKNTGTNYSIGATHFIGLFLSDAEDFRGGLRFRIRRWLSNESSIDLSPGVLLWQTSDYYKTPGFTGSLDFKIEEWFALTLTFEYLRAQYYKREYTHDQHFSSYSDDPEDDIAVYLGIRSGSKTGLKATITAAGTLLFLIVLYSLTTED